MSWPTAPLKYLCLDAGQYGLNVSSNEYSANGIRLIRTSDVSEDGHLRGSEHGVYIDLVPDSRFFLEEGDLLLSRSGTLGRSLLVPALGASRMTFAGYLIRFRPQSNVDPRFLCYVAVSSHFQSAIESDAVTSTIQNFNAERYANIRVPSPPIDEQRRIADFLDAETARMDSTVEIRLRQTSLLQELRSRHREELLGAKEGSPTVGLMYLTESYRPIVYGIVQAGPDVPDGVPYIKTGDLPNLKVEALSRTSPDIHRQYLRAKVTPGDIVMAMRASIGAVAVVPESLPEANLTQGTARIAPSKDVSGTWLFETLQTASVRSQCIRSAVGSTFLTLNIWDLRRIRLPKLSRAEQDAAANEFRRRTAPYEVIALRMEEQVEALRERRQALITAAVTGQFDVTTARGADLS